MANGIEITLITKQGCHLCDDARAVVERVLEQFQIANPSVAVHLEEQDLLGSAELTARYSEEIPVVLIDAKMHAYWRVDSARLLARLEVLAAETATE